ncbi:hypothetical protein NONI108955_08880 [Nocardia ninae]
MTRRMPRIQAVVIPILRAALPEAVKVGSWVEDLDYRQFPMINIRSLGGFRNLERPEDLSAPVIEMTAYTVDGLIETEDLYQDALSALYDAAKRQVLTEHGYLNSVFETMGATQFSSLYMDSWRVQGLIRLGLRPPRKSA